MPRTGPKQSVFISFAAIANALGHAHRLELLELVAQGERSVETLSAWADLTFANTSRHLQILRRARLVETRRSGKHVLYRLAGDAEVTELMKALGRFAERNVAEVERVMVDYFHARDALEPVSREELLARLKADIVAVLDVRLEDEYFLGHIPRSLSIPFGELERRLPELSPNREIVAYCRGPYCVLSFEAVATLRARGFLVHRLEEAAGLPVEVIDGSARRPSIERMCQQ